MYSTAKHAAVGTWDSDFLDMNRDKSRLAYIYSGIKYPDPPDPLFDGHGYVMIKFDDATIDSGTGHFFDDIRQPARVESKYRRVSKDVMGEITGKRRRRLSEKRRIEFLDRFSAQPPAVQGKYRP
jgi:hypothetical protein